MPIVTTLLEAVVEWGHGNREELDADELDELLDRIIQAKAGAAPRSWFTAIIAAESPRVVLLRAVGTSKNKATSMLL